MKPLAAALALACALALAGCGHSPPTRFYVLAPVAPAQPATAANGTPIRVAAVHLPAELDRLEIVSGLSANRIEVRSEDRWAAPLDDMSRRVLTQDLAQRLPPAMLVAAHAPAPRAARALVVDLQAFGVDGAGTARLQGGWSLEGPDHQPQLQRDVDLTAPGAGADPQAQAAAMSRLLGELADQIASVAARG